MCKYNKQNIIIGFAIAKPINKSILKLTKLILFFAKHLFKKDLILCLPNNQNFPIHYPNLLIYSDDDSLFDFSRYFQIIQFNQINDNDILFLLNDTLGDGRKLNSGLLIFIISSIFFINFNIFNKFKIYCPVDSDFYSSWVCPYFLIGRAGYIRSLNFIDWKKAKNLTDKNIRLKMLNWLYSGWRNSNNSSSFKKRVKFKTLLLERNLVNSFCIQNHVCKFSKLNFLRILNSLSI